MEILPLEGHTSFWRFLLLFKHLPWIEFNRRHQVETGTQCFQRHLCLQQGLHPQYALRFGRWRCQSEKASNLSVAIVVPPARRRSISVSALAPGSLQELLAGSILKDSKVTHCEGT